MHGVPIQRARQRSRATRPPPGRPAICLASLVALVGSGCAWYRPAPLPPIEDAARAPRVEEAAIRASLAALANPLLSGVEVDLSNGADPVEFGALAAVLNPDLAALRYQRAQTRAEVLTARLFPNPEISVTANDPYGRASRGLRVARDIAVSLGTRALLTRGARIDASRARVTEVDLSVAWQEWQVAQRTRLVALRLAWLRHRHDIAARELEIAQRTTLSLEHALESGDTTFTQLGVQRAALETVRAAVSDLERSLAHARGEMSALLGGAEWRQLSTPSPDEAAGLPQRPTVEDLLPQCLSQRLDLAALRAGYDAQEADLRRAILEQIPDVRVGLGSTRDETSLKFFGGTVSLDVPLFDRSQGRIELQRATRERLAAEYRARALAVRSTIVGTLDLLGTIEARLPDLRDSLKPLVDIEASERGAAVRGYIDLVSYQTVRLAILDQRLLGARLSQARAEAQVGLDVACGARLGAAAPGTED